MHQYTIKDIVRFNAKFDKSGECWDWNAFKDRQGYGKFRIGGSHKLGGRNVGAHRVAWELAYGEIPNNLCVLHRCDNPSCVNPDHLFLGTIKDNSDDKVAKKRQPRNETHPLHKITMKDANAIRERYKQGGITQTQLGLEYGIDQTSVSLIVIGKIWKE